MTDAERTMRILGGEHWYSAVCPLCGDVVEGWSQDLDILHIDVQTEHGWHDLKADTPGGPVLAVWHGDDALYTNCRMEDL